MGFGALLLVGLVGLVVGIVLYGIVNGFYLQGAR
jgi:hypothetical protein